MSLKFPWTGNAKTLEALPSPAPNATTAARMLIRIFDILLLRWFRPCVTLADRPFGPIDAGQLATLHVRSGSKSGNAQSEHDMSAPGISLGKRR